LPIASELQRTVVQFVAVIFAHQLGPGIGEIIGDIERLINAANEEELWNCVIHLPLR